MNALADHHDALALLALGDALGSRKDLHALYEACPAPLRRWVSDQRHKVLTLALDAIHRGEIPHDDGAVIDYLSRVRFSDAMDAIKGKPLVMIAGTSDGDTALDAGRVMSLMSDAHGSRHTGAATIYGNPQRVASMLRCVSDRQRFLAEMDRTALALAKVSIMEDAGPILAPLASLMRTGAASSVDRSLGDALRAAIGTAERVSDDKGTQGMTWGLKSLDEAIPLRPGRMFVLSAQPGGGKTSLGMQSAHATSTALGNRSVAYLSLEMAASELALALACREVQVPRKQAQERWATLHPDDQRELRDLADRWEAEGALWIRDASAGAVTASEVASWIRTQRQRHGTLQLVVVDYLGLISASNPRHQLTEKTSEITRTLKQLALAEGVAIILLAQLTREGRKSPRGANASPDDPAPVPRMEDLLGGSAIESDADGIVLLHPIQRTGETRRVDAIIAKNRRGPFPLTFPLWFNGKYQYFFDAEKEQEQRTEARKQHAATPQPTEDAFK
jgi:replicative DNA helicase